MTLKEIRSADKQGLKQAMREYIVIADLLTVGENHAINRTIQDRAQDLGVSYDTLNAWNDELSGS